MQKTMRAYQKGFVGVEENSSGSWIHGWMNFAKLKTSPTHLSHTNFPHPILQDECTLIKQKNMTYWKTWHNKAHHSENPHMYVALKWPHNPAAYFLLSRVWDICSVWMSWGYMNPSPLPEGGLQLMWDIIAGVRHYCWAELVKVVSKRKYTPRQVN